MAENSSISWTRHTFNGWIGCTKVSPACKFCYAERDWDHRYHRVKWGPTGPRSLTGPDTWAKPLRWNREAKALGEVHSVFANSLSDNMDDHPSILPEWRERFFRNLVIPTTSLEWLLLTKRPENWERFLPDFREQIPNVRLGVSIEDQERADERAPFLKVAKLFGWKTFVSYGPACGPVDWDAIMPWIDWLVSEGESGPLARPSHPEWFRQARDACAASSTPYHHKQNGEWRWAPDRAHFKEAIPEPWARVESKLPGVRPAFMVREGVKNTGRLLDGVLHDEFPRAE